MTSRVAVIGLLLLGFAMASCSASSGEVKKNGETVMIRGTVRVVGNEPFSRLVLTVQEPEGGKNQKDFVIKGPLEKNIWDQYQGRVIVVEGRYCAETGPEHVPCIEPERIIRVE